MTAAVKNSFVIIDLWEIGYRKTLNISPPKYKFPVYKPIKISTQMKRICGGMLFLINLLNLTPFLKFS